MRITDTSDLWWKTAVIYCLDVETFLDWNDDGVGDFDIQDFFGIDPRLGNHGDFVEMVNGGFSKAPRRKLAFFVGS